MCNGACSVITIFCLVFVGIVICPPLIVIPYLKTTHVFDADEDCFTRTVLNYKTTHMVLSVVLTLLGWIPGVIHGLVLFVMVLASIKNE